ncbi:MAG: hypothetical protein U0936_06920 [Planctomycetaceae bacterium]
MTTASGTRLVVPPARQSYQPVKAITVRDDDTLLATGDGEELFKPESC